MLVNFNTDTKPVDKKKKKKTEKGIFSGIFSKGLEEDKNNIEKLLKEVDKNSNELKEERSFISFEKYKKSVKRLIDTILEKNNSMKKATGKNMLGKKKIYLIKSINAELDVMTRKVLQEQDVLYVINKMEDVRGMLVDTYTD
ncbi:MAG: DUF327 family protein [Candidatus Muiribacteriota bacterium]